MARFNPFAIRQSVVCSLTQLILPLNLARVIKLRPNLSRQVEDYP